MMMNDSEEEEEQTALVCDNGNFYTEILFDYSQFPLIVTNASKTVTIRGNLWL